MIWRKAAGWRVVIFIPRFEVRASAIAPASIVTPPTAREPHSVASQGVEKRPIPPVAKMSAASSPTAPASSAAPRTALDTDVLLRPHMPRTHDRAAGQAQ